jgi:hypothetical protein
MANETLPFLIASSKTKLTAKFISLNKEDHGFRIWTLTRIFLESQLLKVFLRSVLCYGRVFAKPYTRKNKCRYY